MPNADLISERNWRKVIMNFTKTAAIYFTCRIFIQSDTKKSPCGEFCECGEARTLNQWLKRPLLYH